MRRGEVWAVAGGPDYVGKPRPVVVVQDDSGYRLQCWHSGEEVMADADVCADKFLLLWEERARLVEYSIADADLADVVEESAVADEARVALVEG